LETILYRPAGASPETAKLKKGADVALTPVSSEVPGRIARAAVALFSRQGYHGTSTREIARVADVSEVTVFRYFDHKEDIFLSALRSSFSSIKPRLDLFGRGAETRKPEVMLPQILTLLVDIATFSPELTKLVAVAFLELHGKAEEVCFEHLTPLFTAIASYLTTNMDNGKMRSLNPVIVTAAMALTVIAQPELSKLIAGSTFARMGGSDSIGEYSKFWLQVLVPSQQEKSTDVVVAAEEAEG
jgi:AcrR family transcriptional regulator